MKLLLKNSRLALVMLLICTSVLVYLTNRYILTAGFYEINGGPFYGIGDQNATVIYAGMQKWLYLTAALFLLVKVFAIAIVLHTALYLIDEEIPFQRTFGAVVAAEYIFLLPATIKLITFNYTFKHPTLLEWHRYYILSALNLFPEVPADWYYALASMNLFEVAYWFVLAYGLMLASSKKFDDSLRLILCSYVPALFIWVVAVTFFTLLMFPATG